MNESILAQLNDIQTPEPIGNWPLAWGWWLLIALLLITLVSCGFWLRKRWLQQKAKKHALLLLSQLQQQTPVEKMRATSQILKRAALAYAKRDDVAGLSGAKWANWLNQFKPDVQISPELLSLSYQGQVTEQQANEYIQQVQRWLKQVLPLKVTTNKVASRLNTTNTEVNQDV